MMFCFFFHLQFHTKTEKRKEDHSFNSEPLPHSQDTEQKSLVHCKQKLHFYAWCDTQLSAKIEQLVSFLSSSLTRSVTFLSGPHKCDIPVDSGIHARKTDELIKRKRNVRLHYLWYMGYFPPHILSPLWIKLTFFKSIGQVNRNSVFTQGIQASFSICEMEKQPSTWQNRRKELVAASSTDCCGSHSASTFAEISIVSSVNLKAWTFSVRFCFWVSASWLGRQILHFFSPDYKRQIEDFWLPLHCLVCSLHVWAGHTVPKVLMKWKYNSWMLEALLWQLLCCCFIARPDCQLFPSCYIGKWVSAMHWFVTASRFSH